MMTSDKPQSDYIIMQSDPQTNKLVAVGRGWKKQGKNSTFVSISIGPKENRQSYLMFKNDKQKAQNVVEPRTGPPRNMPEQYKPPASFKPSGGGFDDL